MRVNSLSIIIRRNAVQRTPGGRTIQDTAAQEEARIQRGTTTFLRVPFHRIGRQVFALTNWGCVDDLPAIRENLRKGFLDTQTKVNSWVTNLKKRLDGEDTEEEPSHQPEQPSPYGRQRRSGDLGRRSGDRERYDADPQVLGDDFSALELRDHEGGLYPRSTLCLPN